ncbi:hypothetical protein QYE76_071505 [Lolium multiflorum]|uniref:Integrase catalytic domain-containing protein n=1 Tax=Lolium multiflorum TaxID=4521 RepID=A0AAD8SMF3_LOLMU|nr:hypothetical protein QYE76_071505 [Lolium multiflorum]
MAVKTAVETAVEMTRAIPRPRVPEQSSVPPNLDFAMAAALEGFLRIVVSVGVFRFGIPQTITTDGGSVFVSHEFRKFCEDMGIKLIRSSPYYAQANGQAEASNKSLIKLIKRKIDEHPRRWHEVLSEALWAYRMSCHGAIKTSPYHLVYGQEAVLPWEITAGSRRVTFQNDLTTEEYAALMSDSIEDVTELRLWSLEKIKENKAKVARAYNKKVRPKEFHVGDLVWEVVLPLGTKDATYGKWSPNWHGPYRVDQVLKGNAYMLEELNGVKFPVAVNGQHLKKYFPIVPNLGAGALAVVALAPPPYPSALPRDVRRQPGRAASFFVIVVVVVFRPGAHFAGYSEEVSSSTSSSPRRRRYLARRASSALFLQIPSMRKWRLSSRRSRIHHPSTLWRSPNPPVPTARGLVRRIGSYSGSGSLEEEDWKERPEEARRSPWFGGWFFRLLMWNRE